MSWYRLETFGPSGTSTWGALQGMRVDKALQGRLPPAPDKAPGFGVGAVKDWPVRPPLLLECETPRPVLDLVLASDWRHVVSDRFKLLLEEAAGADLQFLPVLLQRRGALLDVGPYWVVNPLRMLDCLHLSSSKVEMQDVYGGRTVTPFPVAQKTEVLVQSRIPRGVGAFAARFTMMSALFLAGEIKSAAAALGLKGVYWRLVSDKGKGKDAKRAVYGGPAKPVWAKGAPRFEHSPLTSRALDGVCKERAAERARDERARAFLAKAVGKSAAEETEIGTPATEAKIASLRKWIGTPLPTLYEEMLRTCGGLDLCGEEVYGIAARGEERCDAREATAGVRGIDGMQWPRHLLVIAGDGRGGDVCLDLSRLKGGDCPVVYHDHELDEIDDKTGRITPSIDKLSPSFGAWLKRVVREGCAV